MSPLVAVAFANLRQWAHFVFGIAITLLVSGQAFAENEPPLQLHKQLPTPSHNSEAPKYILGIHEQFLICIEPEQGLESSVQLIDMEDDAASWKKADLDLEGSFSTAISHPDRGIVLLGQSLEERDRSITKLLTFTRSTGDVRIVDLPDFPEPIQNATGAIHENLIYVFGGHGNQSSPIC